MQTEKLRDYGHHIPSNPHALTRIGLKVVTYMAAVGFAILSLFSLTLYKTEESLPMMTKLSGMSLIFFLAHKNLTG